MDYKLLKNEFYKDKNNYENTYNYRYNSFSTIHFDFNIGEYPAFLVINNELLNIVETIYRNDNILNNITSLMPKVALEDYKINCLVGEIHLTNAIEGVYSTRKEIKDLLNLSEAEKSNEKNRIYGLIQKYEMLGYENIKLESCQDIRNLYNALVLPEIEKDCLPDGLFFRKDKVDVYDTRGVKLVHTGLYPEKNIIETMDKALLMLRNDEYSNLIKIAIFHYLFGYIHPFYDGNGRTSRFISSYLLFENLNQLVSYSLSFIIKENITKYHKSFVITNEDINRGDLTPFVITFLEFINEIYEKLFSNLREKNDKLDFFMDVTEKICEDNNDFKNITFILFQNSLFAFEGISQKEIEFYSDLKANKVRKYINKLDQLGLIRKVRDRRIYRYNIDLDKAKNLY